MHAFTLPDLIHDAARRWPDQPAVETAEGSPVTYQEFAARVDGLAQWLTAAGVGRRDRVGIRLPRSVTELALIFAVNQLGAVFVTLNLRSTPHSLAHVAQDCGLKLLCTDLALPDWSHCPVATPPETISPGDGGIAAAPLDRDLAAVLYTSGSTGRPRGVMLTHLNFLDATRRVTEYLENTAADRVLSLLPLSAPWGVLQATSMFLVGGTVVLPPPTATLPSELAAAVAQRRINGLAALPPSWIQLVRHLQETSQTLPGLRYVTSSGGVIPDPVLADLPVVFPSARIFLTYGLTEGFRTLVLPPEWFARKRGSIGRPTRNAEVFVINERGLCGAGEPGELVQRGSSIMAGYWGNPEATAQALHPCHHLAPWIGNEPVHFTGDLVQRDVDGFYWFLGRMDQQIKSGGYRISPEEVEEMLVRSGRIAAAVVFGEPHEILGESLVAVVDTSTTPPPTESQLRQWSRQHLPAHLQPRRWHLWAGPLPRNGNGKLDRPLIIASATAIL